LPTIGDLARWNNYQKSTYQSFVLIGQGCDEVNDFVHSRLATQSNDNLATIIVSAVHRVIGSLPTAEIDKALKHTLGL
jgi:hypothetical protein